MGEGEGNATTPGTGPGDKAGCFAALPFMSRWPISSCYESAPLLPLLLSVPPTVQAALLAVRQNHAARVIQSYWRGFKKAREAAKKKAKKLEKAKAAKKK